jgi:hypothetical protein
MSDIIIIDIPPKHPHDQNLDMRNSADVAGDTPIAI